MNESSIELWERVFHDRASATTSKDQAKYGETNAGASIEDGDKALQKSESQEEEQEQEQEEREAEQVVSGENLER